MFTVSAVFIIPVFSNFIFILCARCVNQLLNVQFPCLNHAHLSFLSPWLSNISTSFCKRESFCIMTPVICRIAPWFPSPGSIFSSSPGLRSKIRSSASFRVCHLLVVVLPQDEMCRQKLLFTEGNDSALICVMVLFWIQQFSASATWIFVNVPNLNRNKVPTVDVSSVSACVE